MRDWRILCATLGFFVLAGSEAQSAPFTTYGFVGTSGVFSASCSGPGDGGLPNASIPDNRDFFKAGSNCTVNALTPFANSNYSSGSITASGTTASALGSINGSAALTTGQQNAVLFPAGFTDSGWIDTVLISSAGNEGMVAQVTIIVHVNATLSVSGPNVFSRLKLAISSEVASNPALHQPGYQIQAPSAPLVVSDTLLLDLPFIVGTPSQMLVRVMAQAMTSSSTSLGTNTASVAFLNTITWGGIDKVTVGGNEVAFTAVGSDSGINWAEAYTEPPPVPLALGPALPFVIGLAGLAASRRRVARRVPRWTRL
jgi:hypothetical protein